jgi:hypothetical protein
MGSKYSNSREIVEGFYTDQPYSDSDSSLFTELLNPNQKSTRPTLVYLKAQIETDASIRLSRRVSNCQIASIIDDPKESEIQPLAWYINRVNSASAVCLT